MLFTFHSNYRWKIATHYLMFAASGSVYDNEQKKIIKITVHCTVPVFSLCYAMVACPAQSSFPSSMPPFLLMCYFPLFSPPACAAVGSQEIRTRICWSKFNWTTPRWSGGWITWQLQELGFFSLAKKSLTRRGLSAAFNFLCPPAIPKACFLFILMAIYKLKVIKVPRIPGSCTPCDLHFATACLAPKTEVLNVVV